MKKVIVVLATLLASCATSTRQELSDSELANASVVTSAVAVESGKLPVRMPLVAIEVEVSANGVTPIGAKIVHAAPKANAVVGHLRIAAEGAEQFAYTIADPRIQEVRDEDGGHHTEIAESARVFVYVPLIAALKALAIQPLGDTDQSTPGGQFDVRELAKRACERMSPSPPVCQEVAQP